MSRLVTDRSQPIAWTTRRECDSRTAALRGLAEYVRSLEATTSDGVAVRVVRCGYEVPDGEQGAQYPAAYALSPAQDASYDAHSGSPSVLHDFGKGVQLIQAAETQVDVVLTVRCTSNPERRAVAAMLEDAFDPVEFMAGFLLTLPHYYGAVCTYLCSAVAGYDDAADDKGLRRWRDVEFKLRASLPKVRVSRIPPLQIDLRACVSEEPVSEG